MKEPREVIIRPVITEKATRLKELNQYVFEVHPDANKHEIKKAVEELFKVKVKKVRTINVKGKPARRGRIEGRRKSWKKAIVTLKEGDVINLFEGV
ncbi:50S ribosomal protein L23 [bacterium]|nr:MAG: 50S ribosomal protein L23 [bacterium]